MRKTRRHALLGFICLCMAVMFMAFPVRAEESGNADDPDTDKITVTFDYGVNSDLVGNNYVANEKTYT